MMWNNLSCGVVSTAQALLYPKVPNVMVNTGGNLPFAWKTLNQLRNKKITVNVLSSAVQGYASYYDYIKSEGLMPFFMSCCEKAKYRHLDRFYYSLKQKSIVNVGYCKGEEKRANELKKKDRPWRIFNFPMLKYTREECEKILRFHNVKAVSSYCWFCAKGPNPPKWVTDPLLARARASM